MHTGLCNLVETIVGGADPAALLGHARVVGLDHVLDLAAAAVRHAAHPTRPRHPAMLLQSARPTKDD